MLKCKGMGAAVKKSDGGKVAAQPTYYRRGGIVKAPAPKPGKGSGGGGKAC